MQFIQDKSDGNRSRAAVGSAAFLSLALELPRAGVRVRTAFERGRQARLDAGVPGGRAEAGARTWQATQWFGPTSART
jgi:hypothetical protein